MGHTRNAPLAARIAELGLTERELSVLINDAVEVATGKRGRSTDRYVRLLLAGSIRWPWPATRTALEQVLDRSILDLGFVPRGRRCPPPPRLLTLQPAQHVQEDTMDRREMLGIAAGTTISITVPGLPTRGRLGMSDVERLARPLGELIAIDQRVGGVALTPAAASQAERVLGAVARYEVSDRVERALYTLAGGYLASAAWFAVDADELEVASGYLDQARRAANTATDPMLYAQVTNITFMRARQAGDYLFAHTVAKAGLHSTAARLNPRVAALFHSRVGNGHAWRGELGQAQRSLGRAEECLDRVTESTPNPVWLRFFNRSELAGLTAMAYQSLGRYQLAAQNAQLSTDLAAENYLRNRTHTVLHLAEAYLGEREVEHAAKQAATAMAMAGQLRDGLRTGRVARRLRQLRLRFGQWPEVAEARHWIEAYDSAVSG